MRRKSLRRDILSILQIGGDNINLHIEVLTFPRYKENSVVALLLKNRASYPLYICV